MHFSSQSKVIQQSEHMTSFCSFSLSDGLTVIVGMNGDNNNDCCVLALGGDIANCNEENDNDKKIYRTH